MSSDNISDIISVIPLLDELILCWADLFQLQMVFTLTLNMFNLTNAKNQVRNKTFEKLRTPNPDTTWSGHRIKIITFSQSSEPFIDRNLIEICWTQLLCSNFGMILSFLRSTFSIVWQMSKLFMSCVTVQFQNSLSVHTGLGEFIYLLTY